MGIACEVRDGLRGSPLFKGVPDSTIGLLAGAGVRVTAQVGETLWPRKHGASDLFVLLDGWAAVEALTLDGGRLLLRILGPHGVLGPTPPDVAGEVPVSAVALAGCVGVAWRTEAWARADGYARALLANLVETQARYIGELERRCLGLTGETVECRLARILLELCRCAGRATRDGVEIELPLRREDLAGLVGSTMYTISRTMSRWKRAGWVVGRPKRVVVSERRALARVAGGAKQRADSGSPVSRASLR